MRFQDIIGLEEVKRKLIEAVNADHVAHAQLFLGAEGSANLAMALAFANFLNCENRQKDDACGLCASCTKNAKYIHPDLHFVFPTAATLKIKREDATSEKFLKEWRDYLIKTPYGNLSDWSFHFGWENKQLLIPRQESRNIITNLSLKAFEGKFKIMLIWLPELMNGNAANGILKVLEEPPAKTIFLMVSNDENKLLTTIRSRVQLLKIPSFSDENIQHKLKEEGLDEAKTQEIAYLAEGNMREALNLATGGQNLGSDQFKQWMRFCFTFDFQALVKMADEFQSGGKEFQKALLNSGNKVMRDTLIHQYGIEKLERIPEVEKGFVANFSKVFSPEKIAEVVPKIEEANYHIERNANPKILFLDLSIAIAQIARSK
ncbi:MAG: DNA polymerase III subunit delta [Cytophagales bacterium CG12_big_fil_rev_8_21_14_0_65_40_12]|nr:MAG: DNA polymerase III subunit delta [Cytophagales bacterium CG12_big_fil_rev_8_21_14_0_65_40_12]PIW04346.1 MAG: DNA polymerase III subunit delta [Cytophagales bacterium CG17_big_fil_post_rev_8_21_14_2_50_40_13]